MHEKEFQMVNLKSFSGGSIQTDEDTAEFDGLVNISPEQQTKPGTLETADMELLIQLYDFPAWRVTGVIALFIPS